MSGKKFLTVALALAGTAVFAPGAALAAGEPAGIETSVARPAIPPQLDPEQRDGYRAVFAAIRDQRWLDAQLALDSMKPGPLHAIARAELVTAKGSPKADLDPLLKLLADAPELPQAKQIATMAASRGGIGLPPLPEARALIWIDGAPARKRARSIVAGDMTAAELAIKMQPLVKDDRGAEAQALLESTYGLSQDSITEWQRKVAWMYYLAGDDNNARAMAAKASTGYGDFAVEAMWVGALAAWRQHDCVAAGTAFENVAARAGDTDLRSAGLYWAARADMQCGRPDRVEARLKNAAQYRETFYGLLARQALAIKEAPLPSSAKAFAGDWQTLERRPNVRVAAALVEIGETGLADQVIKQQARIGNAAEYPALVRLTSALDLPSTLVWLSHNGPLGASPPLEARFPSPNWAPDGGWRVDKALVFAHALQESRFRTDVVSKAGAYGLMQVMPSAATDIARKQGRVFDRSALSRPGTNFEVGQSYLEQLRDQSCTNGLLPKVIAAYNAGPGPVQLWNLQARDDGDPLLYIESIPYWETRGYVTTVLRNYWVYETQTGRKASVSRSALAQGLWPRFPGLPGAPAVRLSSSNSRQAVASAN
ncbi:lytic transglycosylase domain-containing protein [Sphingomonas sp. CARO-RG-8B-R24-01]|uniref:lytic transglycosylase domain-containing protein n=1 Tax=Sphingomonas sp. CARO-RG-8B-R24-01 TaxID=2914831 RepID=UPI001F5A9AF9|nr:lytic transglycosylase domain-containing protein [Sphingomonas sp. CARO-RG-8B-R24-01]